MPCSAQPVLPIEVYLIDRSECKRELMGAVVPVLERR